MLHADLIEARTADGLTLPGLHVPARGKRGVLIWVPGLGGPFVSHLARTQRLAQALGRQGVGVAVFNTRGSYTVAHLKAKRGKKLRRIAAGEAFERFTDCTLDIDAMVRAVKVLGYKKVFLAGHSTGANKVVYYVSHSKKKVAGAVLLGPVSDIPGLRRELGARFIRLQQAAKRLVRQGRGAELLPGSLAGTWLWSASRFVSLAMSGQPEDTFPYYEPNRAFPWVKRWRVPLLVLLGSSDEFLDRPAPAVLRAFDEQCAGLADYQSRLLRGAEHSLANRAPALARYLVRWVRGRL